ncbi:MAG: pilus assembly PilX N-terminal domain-containing protein [Dehalococcoidia bacterium]|nr:pilus assembly PilX N-terminal domain-containing protein [Dehalococcoidia bacterium]
MLKSEKGIALVAVIVFTLILAIMGFSVISMTNGEIVLTRENANITKAFYLAEAGLEIFNARLVSGKIRSIEETVLGEGSYRVDYYPYADPCAVATGRVGNQEKSIRVSVGFLAPPYECSIYAANLSGEEWNLMLRGQGNPISVYGGEYGGRDIINGNIFADGDVDLYQESSVNPSPAPNTYELNGDVNATGNVNLYDSASISGEITEDASPEISPDLVGMNYAVNNTHNVSQIFTDEGISRGYLPGGHELRNVFVKNPLDRGTECTSTTGNDYFLEPASITGGGTYKEARTPLHLGNDRVYYVDWDVWVHNKTTYGFKVDGKVTIVVTGDIHISDNMLYADSSSMLGLVALGKYDDSGQLVSGGNVYFGDPRYGTMYTISGMMFAANDFLYNTDAITGKPGEPTSGFTVTGNLSALNRVSIERDWYTKSISRWSSERRPAHYDSTTSQWVDSETGDVLTSTQISTLKHYQMIINYDERVRTPDTQPPRLPRGAGSIFAGLTNWEEVQ